MSPSLRRTTRQDSAALAELSARSPDGGRIAVSPRHRVPVVEAIESGGLASLGVVAEEPGVAGVVGSAWVSFGRCRVGGEVLPYALLHSLVVHPDHRRRGIARAMTRWRLDRVDERGDGSLVLAGIQAGNTASLANAATWADQVTGRLVITPVPMRHRPPRPRPGIAVRAVRPDELALVARGINDFHRGFDLFPEQDAGSVAAWLARSPLATPVHHYLVAVDARDRPVAGLGLHDEGLLGSLHVDAMPRAVRLLNVAVRVVPRDGELRTLQSWMPWYAPGSLAAARHLWQTVRWTWRDRASTVLATLDAEDPARRMVDAPFWLPTTSLTVALRTPRRLGEHALLYSLV